MARTASGCVRLSRSLLPRTSRFQASKRAPRKASSSSRSDWIIVPMAPSSTRMRSAAARRSAASAFDIGAGLGIGLGAGLFIASRVFFDCLVGGRGRAAMIRAQPQQMADRVDQIGAVHGVKMEIGYAVIDEIDHLFGGNGCGNELAGGRIIVQSVETVGEPRRHGSAGARGEISCLLEILHRQDSGHDRNGDAGRPHAVEITEVEAILEEEL